MLLLQLVAVIIVVGWVFMDELQANDKKGMREPKPIGDNGKNNSNPAFTVLLIDRQQQLNPVVGCWCLLIVGRRLLIAGLLVVGCWLLAAVFVGVFS